jgi:hypothetical protein
VQDYYHAVKPRLDALSAAYSATNSAATAANLARAAELINSNVDYVGPTRAAMSLYWALNGG